MHLPLYKIEISGIIIIVRCASVAQSVEQGTENPRVIGSIPIGGTKEYVVLSAEADEEAAYSFLADLAHLVERHLAKVEVASSSLVIRSIALYYLFHCKAHKERSCVLYFFCGRRKRANSNPFAFDRNRLTLRHGT